MVQEEKQSNKIDASKSIIKLCIVGDLMQNFSNHKNAITISELENLINSNQLDPSVAKYEIHVGQGVSVNRLNNLNSCILNSKLATLIQIISPAVSDHCNASPNIKKSLISDPKRISYNEFESLLKIEEDCAGLAEPISGRHIQGMILVEAARQIVIAVMEKYFITSDNKNKRDFVTQSMNTAFHQFIYPLAVSIRYKIKEINQTSQVNTASKGIVSFIQNDIVASEVTFQMSVIDSDFIAEKESYLADRCLQEHFAT